MYPGSLAFFPAEIFEMQYYCTNTCVLLKFCIFSCLRFPIFLSVWVCDCFAYISSSPHITYKFVSVYSAIIIRWDRRAFLSHGNLMCHDDRASHLSSKPLNGSDVRVILFVSPKMESWVFNVRQLDEGQMRTSTKSNKWTEE